VPNRHINIWLISSLLEYSPAVQGVGGLRPDCDIVSRVALVKDGDDGIPNTRTCKCLMYIQVGNLQDIQVEVISPSNGNNT